MTESFDPREPKSFINLPIEQKPQPTRVEGDSIDNSAIENPMEAQKEVVNFKKKLEMHISKELSSALSFCDKDLYTSVESLINTGGKFRALLFYDTARCFGYANEENLLTISSALEIIHRASLIHDDLVDQSSVRGQDKTLHVLYGNVPAVYVPNLLRDHVEKMLSNDPSIQKYLMQTYTQICEGQILESQISRSGKTRWEDYEKIVELKSAGLGEFALEREWLVKERARLKNQLHILLHRIHNSEYRTKFKDPFALKALRYWKRSVPRNTVTEVKPLFLFVHFS